ncbi:hypothetical protein CN072_26345, partial [Sinorhizobium meliloti]
MASRPYDAASDRPVSTRSLASLCCVQKRAARAPPFGSGWIVLRLSPYHIMSIPPIPPMPPGIAGASFF